MNEAIQFERKALKLSLSLCRCVVVVRRHIQKPLYVCSQQHCHCHGKSFAATDFPLLILFASERVSSCDNFIINRISTAWNFAWRMKHTDDSIELLWDARFPSHLMMGSTEHVENSKCRNEKFLVLFHFHCSLCEA